jgi:hypothetical protein
VLVDIGPTELWDVLIVLVEDWVVLDGAWLLYDVVVDEMCVLEGDWVVVVTVVRVVERVEVEDSVVEESPPEVE